MPLHAALTVLAYPGCTEIESYAGRGYYMVDFALRHRYVTVSIGVAILIITVSYIQSGRMGFELFPKVESDYAKVTAVRVEPADDPGPTGFEQRSTQ